MSTKTTFKRIALVAVAALGLGVLTSVAPASATSNTDLAASLSVGTIPTPAVGVVNTTPVTVSYTGTAGGSDTFTVNVRVTSAPAGSQYRSLTTNLVTGVTASGNTIAAKLAIAKSTSNVGTLGTNTAWTDSVTVGSIFTSAASSSTAKSASFDVSFTPDVAGAYTILVSTEGIASQAALVNTAGVGTPYTAGDANITYTATTASSTSTVALTAVTGAAPAGGNTFGQVVKVSIKDAAGAASQLGVNETVAISTNQTTTTMDVINQTTWASPSSFATTLALTSANFKNGSAYIYVKDSTATATTSIITASGSGLLSSSIVGTLSVTSTLLAACTVATMSDPTSAVRPGSGHVGYATAADTAATTATSHSYRVSCPTANDDTTSRLTVTDTSAKILGIVAGLKYDTTVDTAIDAATVALSTTNYGSVTIAAALSTAGQSFSFTVDGSTTDGIVTVTSATAVGTTGSVAASVVRAGHGASTALTYTLKDQFGAATPNVVVTISTTGRNASTTSTTAVTDASGMVSYTAVDAGTSATSNKTDVVTFTPTAGTAKTVTLNYTDTTLGVSAVELETPTTDDTAATGVTYSDINASSTAGAAASTKTITATVTDVNGAILSGVPVTFATASAGAGILTTTVTVVTGADGTASASVFGWTAGVKTFTATAGGKSATGTVAFRQGGATGTDSPTEVRNITAVASGNSIIVTAKDRFGNIVSGVPLFATRTGNGTFGGGSNTNGQTTGADGTAEFLFNAGSADSVVTITAGSTSAVANACYGQTGHAAGKNVCSTAATQTAYTAATVGTATTAQTGVGDTLSPAGNQSVTVNFAAAVNSADTAADAAAEATDAANAATDAANAAAEAADAATAAAQDAADAVAALSAQVATLISGLKSQLTALTNLVIKIQKKVKA